MRHIVIRGSTQALFLITLIFSVGSISIRSQTGAFAANYVPFSGRITIADARKAAVGPKKVDFNQMGAILQSAWDKARAEITKKGDDFLRERNVGGGVRTSNNVIILAEKGYPLISTTSSGFSIKFLLPNTIATTIRTPTPLPAWMDPRVAISCDAVLKVDVFWTDYRMTVTPATLVIGCRAPQGRNITGDLAVGVVGMIRDLGGPDFIGQALAPINRGNFPLSPQITRDLSKYFDGKVGANTSIEVVNFRDGVDGNGKAAHRVILTIVDKAKEYVIH